MHIYFSAIGGAGISALAQVAHKAGYQVSGSDAVETSYFSYLQNHGVDAIHVGQTRDQIAAIHAQTPIDWFVRSSAVPDDNEEVLFCQEQGIKASKRDEFLNYILQDQGLKLIAIAGTHGKSTTTAMTVWLFQQLAIPFSYLLPAKTSFADMGDFVPGSEFFIYECDEFDRNFLAFEPYVSLLTGVSWDHHEIFPTRNDYQQAFRDFIAQSETTFVWHDDYTYLAQGYPQLTNVDSKDDLHHRLKIQDEATESVQNISLKGLYNRRDAWLAVQATHQATGISVGALMESMDNFPGLQRRMEQIRPNLYSDYAHTPEKIGGAMSAALELAAENDQDLIVVYEPLTNRRQHYMLNDYKDCFAGAAQVYWIPSYLAREDPDQRIIPPEELIARLADPTIATPAERDQRLKETIEAHLAKGDMVVAMAGGGGNSLDDWLRAEFQD